MAIIEELTVEFSEGFNVLTGETGAGKSIIIGALNLCLGEKFSAEDIRSGAKEGAVEAVFSLPREVQTLQMASQLGIPSEGGELFIRRVFGETGRSRAYVNGSPVAVSALKSLGDHLLDIHGQHQHQQLIHQEHHLYVLDAYGRLLPLRTRLEEDYALLQEAQSRLEKLKEKDRERYRLQDLLSYQVREIESARLTAGEDSKLERDISLLQHAAKLTEAAGTAYSILYEAEGSATELIARALSHVEEITQLDPQMSDLLHEGKASMYQLQDIAERLRSYGDKVVFDPARLSQAEERLQQIRDLKKKYGQTIEKVLAFREDAISQLNDLETCSEEIEKLESRLAGLRRDLAERSLDLSRKRGEAARRLEAEAAPELTQLSMDGALLIADLKQSPDQEGFVEHEGRKVRLYPWGIDNAEFLFSANPGEDPKPLSRIASGGELARVMLALKSILAEADKVHTLVFDEVDAGIGGRVAEAVGRKLKAVAGKRQVFCVTHLPQIAAMAAHHYRVEKTVSGGRNVTSVRKLSRQERLEEIARMSGGERITPATLAHARELLKDKSQ